MTKKATEKTKAKIPPWQNQGHNGPNPKGNDTITRIPDIEPMIYQRIISKEETESTDTTKKNNGNNNNYKRRKGGPIFDGNCHGCGKHGHGKAECCGN